MGQGFMIVGMTGVAALAFVILFVRRRSPTESEPPLETLRRRGPGSALVAPVPPPIDDEPVFRPRPSLGLTPWSAEEESEPAEPGAIPSLHVVHPGRDEAAPADEVAPIGSEEPVDEPELPKDFTIPRGVSLADPEDEPEPAMLAALDDRPLVLMSKPKRSPDPSPSGQASTVPAEIEESVSVVLRRQVPVSDLMPRSWLGGLPRMEASVEWPRAVSPDRPDEGERPLHFAAQIACQDLPAELWGGLGPRNGWLLFFLNPLDEGGDDPRDVRVLHVAQPGPVRPPPDDLPPVDEETRPGPDYRHCRTVSDIPRNWRRWPVDLVAFPNEIFDDGNRICASPPDIARVLYDCAPIDPEQADAEADAPLSWRGALYVVDSVLRELDEGVIGKPPSAAQREVLVRDGYVASIIPELRAQEEVWLHDGPGAILSRSGALGERDTELRDRVARLAEARRESLERVAAFIVQNPNAESIVARCEHDRKAEADWRRGVTAGLEAIREQILAQPLDGPFSAADWDALRAHLDGQRFIGWSVEWTSRNTEFPVSLVQRTVSLLELAEAGRNAAVVELAADYQSDAALRGQVPDALRARLEPHWRAITDNRPHRMGGYHDGLQTDPEEGPQEELLLLQLASDDAMHWSWGDGGAYFITIAPRDLAAHRFDRARIRLELP
jgi:uncharacterized protein YwqG